MRGRSAIDMTGQKIGRLEVVARANPPYVYSDKKQAWWLCACDCGGEKVALGCSLRKSTRGKGGTKSCGCLVGDVVRARVAAGRKPGGRRPIDMTGVRIGPWRVLNRAYEPGAKSGTTKWFCMHDDGRTKISYGNNLRKSLAIQPVASAAATSKTTGKSN